VVFSGTAVSSTNKTDRFYNIAEILLKMALNTITPKYSYLSESIFRCSSKNDVVVLVSLIPLALLSNITPYHHHRTWPGQNKKRK
jgi:hypothetical protein